MSYYIRVDPRRGMRFSSTEVFELLVAVAALTLAFALVLANRSGGVVALARASLLMFLLVLGGSFMAVVTGFILHELAHKAVAQRYGCFAEFRYYPLGLLLGVITAALGFIFAAPGAVMISGTVTPRQNARISVAGPGANLVIAAVFLGLAIMSGASPSRFADVASFLVVNVAFVNLLLGGFNLIPFRPLDGAKILASNKVAWVAMVAVLVALYALGSWIGVF